MIGTGLTPEGINQNYVIYELMTESAWRTAPVNLTEWIESYTTRRYGSSDDNAKNAWRILQVILLQIVEDFVITLLFQRTIYDFSESYRIMGQFVIAKSPNFQLSIQVLLLKKNNVFAAFFLLNKRIVLQNWYPMEDLLDAWTSLLAASDNLQNSPGYLHDLVDVTRQVLQVYGDEFYTGIVDSYTVGDVHSFEYVANLIVTILLLRKLLVITV
jgi:alpha-N-acetylglucosaminidase